MDLGQDKMLSGVMIQGGKHRDKNVFMKRFRLGYSLDGEDWAMVREDNSTRLKVGGGGGVPQTAGSTPGGSTNRSAAPGSKLPPKLQTCAAEFLVTGGKRMKCRL